MALELLAGPATVINRDSGSPLSDGLDGNALWIDGVGLLVPHAGLYIVQLDGSAYWVGEGHTGTYGLYLSGQPSGVDADPTTMRQDYAVSRQATTSQGVWELNRIVYVRGKRLAESFVIFGSSTFARLHDRFIVPVGSRIKTRPLDLSSKEVTETTLSGITEAAYLSWAGLGSELVVGASDGKLTRYDWQARQQRGPVRYTGLANVGLWYSPALDVYISLHRAAGTLQIRVWATTPVPVAISPPSASSAPTAGRCSRVSVRITGAHGEGCPGEVVTWRLSGAGSLSRKHSASDDDGYAHTEFMVPLTAEGQAEITAELVL